MSRFPFASLDLSLLPAPAAVPVDYETIRQQRLDLFKSLWSQVVAANPDLGSYNADLLESDPVVVLQEAAATREMLDLQAINDAVRSVMLAFATKADQDQLLALLGLRRLIITPANTNTSPPTPAVMETDDDFRHRAQYALDGLAPGISGGGYRYIVTSAAPEVKNIGLIKRPGGYIDVILLGRGTDGTVTNDVVGRVNDILQADDGGQLTDIVSVRSAMPKAYAIIVTAIIPNGPSADTVKTNATAALQAAANSLMQIGQNVPTDALIAAGRISPITKFILVSPSADVITAPDEVPFCQSIIVNVQVDNG